MTLHEATKVPGFRAIYCVIGALYVLLGSSMLVRGAVVAMQPFAVPDAVLRSPHFADFFHFTFVHMVVLGVLLFLMGRFLEGARPQQITSRVMFLVSAHYTYLDLRTSDSPLGNHLYHGPETLIPPLIDVIVTVCFAYLSLRPARSAEPMP